MLCKLFIPIIFYFQYINCCSDCIQINITEIKNSSMHNESENSNGNILFIRALPLVQEKTTLYPTSTESIGNISGGAVPAALHLWQNLCFSEGYLSNVNEHWLSFPPPSRTAHTFLAILYIFIMTMGVLGNSLVIFMFMKCKSLRTAANILVTNLAVSDLLMMMEMPIFILNSFYEGDAAGQIGCSIYGFMGGLSGTVSIMTLAAISIDRYYVVLYPLHRASATVRARVCVLLVWIYGVIFAGIPLLNLPLGKYVPEGYLTSCSFDYLVDDDSARHFILGYFFAAWVAPLFIICFCYVRIIKVVVQARHMGGKGVGESSRHIKDEEQKKTEIRLAMIVLAIIGLWFAAWTPYASVALLGISGNSHLISPLASMIPALFAKSAACLDPFVYAITNQKFREELGNVFPIFKSKGKNKNNKMKNLDKKEDKSISVIGRNESEDGVEEVIVMMDDPSAIIAPKITSKNADQVNLQTNKPNITPVRQEKKNSLKRNTAAWVLKPTFSNRTSSLRNLARTWNRSKDSSVDDNGHI